MKLIKSIEKSKLFKRLQEAPADNEAVRSTLAANVQSVVDQSKWISAQIVRFLPQYTLHNETHLFNVLSIMEELLPQKTLNQLTPLECALCILAAFTHDLGMALSDEEHRQLTGSEDSPARRQFLRHRDERFAEDYRQIIFLRSQKTDEAHQRANLMKGHILADYLRRTHAPDDTQTSRVASWFAKIKQTTKNQALFQYGNINFERKLTLIVNSHNQEAHWLRQQLTAGGHEKSFISRVGHEGQVNYAFPGLLLRLADYMDFDASRAPDILFHHFGIDDRISVQEWQKHMAITGVEFADQQDDLCLTYEADGCTHPVIHKTICRFCSDIEQSVRRTADELHHQQRILALPATAYRLRLPDKVVADVRPALDEAGRKCYIYHPLEFRLDQDEIQQLLMGEPLYGDPTLALRELLQNALDALQMRNLRLKLLHKDPKAAVEPTDMLPAGAELAVRLTWGKDAKTNQEFIRVADNGSGMTKDVLEKFFTQIGKSYYRSPDFSREQALMRSAGFFATPISQFGIGILSCFMIGERLEVRTRAGHADKLGREAYDVTVSGPGSLFWLRPGTLEHQGTEVTVYLKSRFQLNPQLDLLVPRLLSHFGYFSIQGRGDKEEFISKQGSVFIDPPLIAAKHVVWPMFPLLLEQAADGKLLRIDDRFHFEKLIPIDYEKVKAKAQEWDCPPEWLGKLRWAFCDWTDDQAGDQATGSRIRLIYPMHFETNTQGPCDPPANVKLCRQDEIATFVETTLPLSGRNQHLVKSMAIDSACSSKLRLLEAALGSFLWIDLRGAAAPQLTVDRQKALPRMDVENWPDVVQGVYQRWAGYAGKHWQTLGIRNRLWLQSIAWHHTLQPKSEAEVHSRVSLNAVANGSWWGPNVGKSGHGWLVSIMAQEVGMSQLLNRARDITLNRAFCRTPRLESADFFGRHLARGRARSRALALNLALAHRHVFTDAHQQIHQKFTWAFMPKACGVNVSVLEENLKLSPLPEALNPVLELSFPPVGCNALRGAAGNGILTAPLTLDFRFAPDGRTTIPADEKGTTPEPLVSRGYDLVFPLTNIPLGNLHRLCPEWRTDRSLRPVGILPFIALMEEEWLRKHAGKFQTLFHTPFIQALLPKSELWDKLFSNWSQEDWYNCGLSALWDIPTGKVFWATGAHTTEELRRIGQPFAKFFGIKNPYV